MVGVDATGGGGHPSGEPFMFAFLMELEEFILKRKTLKVEDLKNKSNKTD